MVIYKNLYPEDFDLLQKGHGYVYALFEQKKQLLGSAKACLEDKLQALHDRLDNAGMETLRSMDELNALYFPLSGSEITIEETDVSNLSRIELVRRILEKPDTVKYTYFTRINYSKYTNTESWIDVAENGQKWKQMRSISAAKPI